MSLKIIDHPVVVTVPVYNEIPYIRETLESLAAQTYTDFRVLVSDNASTDGTAEVCETFCASDPRFVFVRQPTNIGAYGNFIHCLQSTRSSYFMWLGGHDTLHPDFLRLAVERMETDTHISLVYSFTRWINEQGRTTKITNGGDYVYREPLTPVDRYVKMLNSLNTCEAVNQLIRRDFLDLRIEEVVSGDLPIMCHLAAHGPFSRLDMPLYNRREFSVRNTTSMERVTGKPKAKPDHVALAWNFVRNVESHRNLTPRDRLQAVSRVLQWMDRRFGVLALS
jgi:glycosyltransferase involved in cell wall biosynthesis